MKDSVTKALIYQTNGYDDKAKEICINILKQDPKNSQALAILKKIEKKANFGVNRQKLDLFLSGYKEDRIEFERWLLEL